MLTGFIKDDKPILSVPIGSGTNVQELPALVDTGFTGELKIPPNIAQQLDIDTAAVREVLMGDGNRVAHRSGLAFVSLEGIKREVSVLVGNGPIIIGVRLMRNFGYTLTVDFPNDHFVLSRGKDPFEMEE